MNRARTPLSRLLRAQGIGALTSLLTLTACPPHQLGAAPSSQFARLDEGTNSSAMADAAAPSSPDDVQRVADATPGNGASASPSTAADNGRFSRYIAMGDSFASGVGASNVQTLPCGQSDNAWPPLVYTALGIASPLIFAACSGATTQDVAAVGNLQTGGYTTGSQISQLPAPEELDSALITITIGGNDIKLDDSVAKCMSSASSSKSSWSLSCLDLAKTLNNASAVVMDSLGTSLSYTFGLLRSAAPNATIVAVGYPHLVDATSACDSTLVGKLISRANREKMNKLADDINTQIKSAAEVAGIQSITDEVANAFAGHEACSPEEWIVSGRNIFADKNSGVAHPNDQGQRVYAQTVLAGLPAAPMRIAVADPMQSSAPASTPPMTSSAPAGKAAIPGQPAPSQPGIGKPAQVSGSAGSKADALGSAGSNAEEGGYGGSVAATDGSAGSNAEEGGYGGSQAVIDGSAGSNAEEDGSAGAPTEPPRDDNSGAEPPPDDSWWSQPAGSPAPADAGSGD